MLDLIDKEQDKSARLKTTEDIQPAFKSFLNSLGDMPKADKDILKAAFNLANDAHKGIVRKSGEPYIFHPMAVATILVKEFGVADRISIVCAFLHDVVEDSSYELSDIEHQFGKHTAEIIDGLTKIVDATFDEDMISEQAENFRKILLTISDDIRVVIIKLADRLHNMRTLESMKKVSALKIASETLFIYAPLAHRLGLYEIKSELEDLSLKHSQPQVYEELYNRLEASKREFKDYIDAFIEQIRDNLQRTELKYYVKYRFKSIYSIYSKIHTKGVKFEEIYDLYAIRVILQTREDTEQDDCWLVYSNISRLFPPNPKRLRDWITTPKDNGYESLHTTVRGPEGRWVEVQIRTQRMDDVAEKGVAAHWKYKEDGELQDEFLTELISQVRETLENPSLTALEAVREFRENLQPNDVFVFTPKGRQVRLPVGSFVLDFAYKIHSDIGHKAIGAKVGNHVVGLEYQLRTGDVIEVLTSSVGTPAESWLNYVRTPRARDAVRLELRKARRELVEKGMHIVDWTRNRYNVENWEYILKELLAYFLIHNEEELYYQIGNKLLAAEKFREYIHKKQAGLPIERVDYERWEAERKRSESMFEEMGVQPDQLLVGKDTHIDHYVLAQCCRPVAGDDILGFEEKTQVVIHRATCPNAVRLMSSFGSRIVQARWMPNKSDVAFLAALRIIGFDKQGMLTELTKVFSDKLKLNIRKVIIESMDGMFVGFFYVYVKNTEVLGELVDKLSELENVQSVTRHEVESQS